jgi:hypothetical protein
LDKQFPGFVTRWFNDQDDRIQRAEDAGYLFVNRTEVGQVGDKDVSNGKTGNTDLNSKVSRVVGRTAQSQPIRAFLMKIPHELYNEDQAAKEEVNRRVDDAIRAGKSGGAAIENQYGNVEISKTAMA